MGQMSELTLAKSQSPPEINFAYLPENTPINPGLRQSLARQMSGEAMNECHGSTVSFL